MILRPASTQEDLTGATHQGLVSGSGIFKLPSRLLGAINVSADGTNAASVTVRKDSATGEIIFQQLTTSPVFVTAPIQASETCHYTVSGTGAAAQFFEWIE